MTRSVAVNKEGRTDSFNAERMVPIAEGVKGVFIVKRDSLVTWDLRASEEADRSGRASFRGDSVADGLFEGVVKADWNWSMRARVVLRRTASCFDILRGIV